MSGSDADWTGRDWREARSIPISFLEELGQEDFWRCFVGKWGADALKIYPWTEGRLVQKSGNTLKTQIYSRPKQERAWLEAAQQVSYKNPGPLTPDDIIAVRIANRRISRGKDINKFVKTRRRLNEQKRKEQLEETPAPEVSQEEDAPNGTQQEGKTPAVVIAELGKETPWQMRAQHIKIQKDLLNNQSSLRAEDEERVQHFLKREDFGTPDYLEAQGELMKSNKKDCESFRKWIQTAVDDELLSGYEGLLEGYEEMKVLLGRVSRQSSEDREIQKTRKATNDECGALLRRARACRARGEHKKCCDYCKEVLSKDDIAHYLCAGAFLLYGLSTTDKELKVWYLSEAVRIYKLIEHFERKEGKEPSNSTRNKTQHAEQRLQEAKAELDAANAAAAKTSPPGPKIISTILPSTPPNPTGPKPADIPLGKKPRKPFTGFGNPPPSPSTPSRNLDPAPKGMSPLEVMRHRRTFKVINQARRNFFNGDIDLAERGYLQLLSFEETSAWQKARCNVFLASIETRDDRAERARTALNMYREFLKMYPEDQRCVVAVRDAKELLKRVLKEIGWEKGARMSGGLGYGHPGLGNGFVGSGLDAISEGEGESGSEGGDEKIKQAKKGKEQSSFVAGVVGKVARLLGLKRTREDDDDGVSDKGGKGRKAARFA